MNEWTSRHYLEKWIEGAARVAQLINQSIACHPWSANDGACGYIGVKRLYWPRNLLLASYWLETLLEELHWPGTLRITVIGKKDDKDVVLCTTCDVKDHGHLCCLFIVEQRTERKGVCHTISILSVERSKFKEKRKIERNVEWKEEEG